MTCSWVRKQGFYSLEGLDSKAIMAFSTRKFLPAVKEDLDFMISERQRFLGNFDLNIENLVCPIQVHSVQAFQAFESDKGKGAFQPDDTLNGVDILLTNEKGLILSVFTADCLPLFVYDPIKKAVALAHIGWRGLAQAAHNVTIKKMNECSLSQPEDLVVGFGPTIRSCCYEVKEPVTNYFRKFLERRDNKNYLDLTKLARLQLIESEVKEGNIFDSGICTYCKNEDFFSFRREGEAADRIISIITLK